MTPMADSFTPSADQIVWFLRFGLALVSVWIVQKLKITERFPWMTQYTDKTNQLASVLIAVVITAVIHWRHFVQYDASALTHWVIVIDGEHKALLFRDAAIQWGMQYGIYRIGLKDSIKQLFTFLGVGPPVATSEVTKREVITDPESGVRVVKDSVATVTTTQETPAEKP